MEVENVDIHKTVKQQRNRHGKLVMCHPFVHGHWLTTSKSDEPAQTHNERKLERWVHLVLSLSFFDRGWDPHS